MEQPLGFDSTEESVSDIHVLQREEHCRYLGIQVGQTPSNASNWSKCIQALRVRLRLARLKTHSVAQRAAIASAVIIPKVLYVARHSWPSTAIVNQLHDLVKQFVWGSRSGKPAKPWMKEEQAELKKMNGGLSVPNIITELMTMSATAVSRWAITTSHIDQVIGEILLHNTRTSSTYITPLDAIPRRPLQLRDNMWTTGAALCASLHSRPYEHRERDNVRWCYEHFKSTIVQTQWDGDVFQIDLSSKMSDRLPGIIAEGRKLLGTAQLGDILRWEWIRPGVLNFIPTCGISGFSRPSIRALERLCATLVSNFPQLLYRPQQTNVLRLYNGQRHYNHEWHLHTSEATLTHVDTTLVKATHTLHSAMDCDVMATRDLNGQKVSFHEKADLSCSNPECSQVVQSSVQHLFWECPKAKLVWNYFYALWAKIGITPGHDPAIWIFSLDLPHTPRHTWTAIKRHIIGHKCSNEHLQDHLYPVAHTLWRYMSASLIQAIWCAHLRRMDSDPIESTAEMAIMMTRLEAGMRNLTRLAEAQAGDSDDHTVAAVLKAYVDCFLSQTDAIPLTPNDTRGVYLLFFDGGSRGNPGPGGTGSIIVRVHKDSHTASLIWAASMAYSRKDTTNNFAEYWGLIHGLREAQRSHLEPLYVIGDSALIISQQRMHRSPRQHRLARLYQTSRRLADCIDIRGWYHHYRAFNKMADSAANLAMDTRTSTQIKELVFLTFASVYTKPQLVSTKPSALTWQLRFTLRRDYGQYTVKTVSFLKECNLASFNVRREEERVFSVRLPTMTATLTSKRRAVLRKLEPWSRKHTKREYKWISNGMGTITAVPVSERSHTDYIQMQRQANGVLWTVTDWTGDATCQQNVAMIEEEIKTVGWTFKPHHLTTHCPWLVHERTPPNSIQKTIDRARTRRLHSKLYQGLGGLVDKLNEVAKTDQWYSHVRYRLPADLWKQRGCLTPYQMWTTYRISTMQLNLFHPGRIESSACPSNAGCGETKETISHIVWSYKRAQAAWTAFLGRWIGRTLTEQALNLFLPHVASRTAPPGQRPLLRKLEKSFGVLERQDLSRQLEAWATARLYFDGGARGNPGPGGSGLALIFLNERSNRWELKACGYAYMGPEVTNNWCEYSALKDGLAYSAHCLQHYEVKFEVFGDSQMIIASQNGFSSIRQTELQPLAVRVNQIIANFAWISWNHTKREQNKMADLLSNIAMNCKSAKILTDESRGDDQVLLSQVAVLLDNDIGATPVTIVDTKYNSTAATFLFIFQFASSRKVPKQPPSQTKMTKIAIVYYSTYGHIAKMAETIKEGVESVEGVTAEIYQVPETLPEEVLTLIHAPPKKDHPIVTPDVLKEADGILFGFPTRFGSFPSQVKSFLDSTGGLWQTGALVGKPAGIFFSTGTQGGGQETTAFTTLTYLAHQGLTFVPLGCRSPLLFNFEEIHGGSPWGAGTYAGPDGSRQPSKLELDVAKVQGESFAQVAKKLSA
ncbi:Nad quinone oxidoreductase, partial [Globisporangium splendens]